MPDTHHVLSLLPRTKHQQTLSTAVFEADRQSICSTGLMIGTGEIDGTGNYLLTKAQQFKHILGTTHRGLMNNYDCTIHAPPTNKCLEP